VALGIETRGHAKKPINKALFADLWARGVSGPELAAHFGYTDKESAYRTARRLGLPKRGSGPRTNAQKLPQALEAILAEKMREAA
jgi:hypothetical protein